MLGRLVKVIFTNEHLKFQRTIRQLRVENMNREDKVCIWAVKFFSAPIVLTARKSDNLTRVEILKSFSGENRPSQ